MALAKDWYKNDKDNFFFNPLNLLINDFTIVGGMPRNLYNYPLPEMWYNKTCERFSINMIADVMSHKELKDVVLISLAESKNGSKRFYLYLYDMVHWK